MITLVFHIDYKCYWDGGLVHVFIIDGCKFTIEDLI